MITLVTVTEEDPITKRKTLLVSHGIDEDTGKVVILPCEPPQNLGAIWNDDMQSYVIPDEPPAQAPEIDSAMPAEENWNRVFGF